MTDIQIAKVNETFVRIIADKPLILELYNKFSFRAANFFFHPLYKNKVWDGYIHLLNLSNHYIYYGLVPDIVAYCIERKYSIKLIGEFDHVEFSLFEAEKFIKELQVTLAPRDYQIDTLIHGIRANRAIFISPTGSGKSLSIYLLIQYYKLKTLLIVPTTNLVQQMYSDFINYGCKNDDIYLIGSEKNTDKRISITTWQSIYTLPKEWFDQFDVVIGDEVHLFQAKSLKTIMENLSDCKYRFGFTGTLDESKTNEMILQGLFGHKKIITTIKELVEEKYLTKPLIKAILLKYPEEYKVARTYQQEIFFLINNQQRNRFITNLALSLKDNTLVLVNELEHADILEKQIKSETTRSVFKITGAMEGIERDTLRKSIEDYSDAIIIASKVFSVGININRLHNLILARPTKARVKTLQSLGRGLRLHDEKHIFTVFDIADDLSITPEKPNYTLKHYKERVKIFTKEDINHKIYMVQLKNI